MKLEKITHDHLLTKWLKVIIFALLMLAPIFSIAVRCAYVICNKNAYQSYYGETINNYELVNTNDIKIDKKYNFSNKNISYLPTGSNFTAEFTLNEFDYIYTSDNSLLSFINSNNSEIIKMSFTFYTNLEFRLFTESSNTTYFNINTTTLEFNFNLLSYTNVEKLDSMPYFNEIKYNQYSYLDNVFDYSVNKLRNDQLFNWTQNTGVYTGVNAMTTGLGMTDGTIAILLTYWMLLTIIYVIIDIVLAGFTMLTHMIYNKKVD